ncbi:AI-2E family transporter [soil metagenome]
MVDRIRRAGQVAWAVVGVIALLALIGFIVWYLRVVLPPLLLAGAIVFILNPVVTWFQRRHIPRAAGTALTYLGFLLMLVVVGLLIAPIFSDQGQELSERWPRLRDEVEGWVDDVAERSQRNDWVVKFPSVAEIESDLGDDRDIGARLDTVRDVGLRVFHVALILLLAPIIAFYLLVDLPHVRRVAESLIPHRVKPEVMVLARRLNRAIGGYFRGQLVVAIIVGALVSIGLAIIELPFWLIIGMVAGLFNMIPLIGPWIGAVPGVLIALTTRDASTALWVVALMAAAQQVDNHFITPNVMQRAVKLHPATVMLALLAGGTLGGFFGLLMVVPTTAVLKIVGGHLWRTYIMDEPIEEVAARWEADEAAHRGGIVSVARNTTAGAETGPFEMSPGDTAAGPVAEVTEVGGDAEEDDPDARPAPTRIG